MCTISFEIVKRWLDHDLYWWLDVLQKHMLAIFKRAQRLALTDSQVSEDMVKVREHFVTTRGVMSDGFRTVAETTQASKVDAESPEEDDVFIEHRYASKVKSWSKLKLKNMRKPMILRVGLISKKIKVRKKWNK